MAKQVAIYQSKSLGAGYSLLQDAFSASDVELIESIPGGGGLTLILKGDENTLKDLAVKAGADSRYGFHLIQSHGESILKSFYSLSTTGLAKHLGILETENSVEIFRIAEMAVSEGLQVTELRLSRGSGIGRGHLILSGDNKEALENIGSKIKADARWTTIMDRSAKFDDLF